MRQDGKKLKKWSTVSQKIYHIYANNCQKNDRQVLIFLVKINQDIFNLIFIGGRGGGCTPNTNSRIEKIYEFSSHGIWFYTFPNRITSLSCSKKVLGATVDYCGPYCEPYCGPNCGSHCNCFTFCKESTKSL